MDMFLLECQQTNLFGANGVTIFHDAKPKVTTVPLITKHTLFLRGAH
jgi:hypothetical protein